MVDRLNLTDTLLFVNNILTKSNEKVQQQKNWIYTERHGS